MQDDSEVDDWSSSSIRKGEAQRVLKELILVSLSIRCKRLFLYTVGWHFMSVWSAALDSSDVPLSYSIIPLAHSISYNHHNTDLYPLLNI